MNSIALPIYHHLLARLNQMSIRGNRHKMAVYVNLNPDQQSASETSLMTSQVENAVLAFHIMFERDNPDSDWRLVIPLRFTD